MNKKIFMIIVIIISSFSTILTIGFLFSQKEQEAKKIEIYEEPYYVLNSMGDKTRRFGDFSSAFTYYQHSVSLNSKNPYPYIWMAYMYNEEKLIIQAQAELQNALAYKEFLENDVYDLYNLYILESYISFNSGNIKKAQDILLSKVLQTEDINYFSPVFTELKLNSNDRKFLSIFGDTYIILLYLKYFYLKEEFQKDKEELEKEQIKNIKPELSKLEKYKLDIENDVNKNNNIQSLLEAEFKSDLIAYLVLYTNNLNMENKRKYVNLLNIKNNEEMINYYKNFINNPFLIHDFDNY